MDLRLDPGLIVEDALSHHEARAETLVDLSPSTAIRFLQRDKENIMLPKDTRSCCLLLSHNYTLCALTPRTFRPPNVIVKLDLAWYPVGYLKISHNCWYNYDAIQDQDGTWSPIPEKLMA